MPFKAFNKHFYTISLYKLTNTLTQKAKRINKRLITVMKTIRVDRTSIRVEDCEKIILC